mmetsp:Transcript_40890/g.97183  ORF Transcript_40890/g.97183 Transcript_40890/m.97183 type:complete len:218 (-) Transcript_40890:1075-1728(-)
MVFKSCPNRGRSSPPRASPDWSPAQGSAHQGFCRHFLSWFVKRACRGRWTHARMSRRRTRRASEQRTGEAARRPRSGGPSSVQGFRAGHALRDIRSCPLARVRPWAGLELGARPPDARAGGARGPEPAARAAIRPGRCPLMPSCWPSRPSGARRCSFSRCAPAPRSGGSGRGQRGTCPGRCTRRSCGNGRSGHPTGSRGACSQGGAVRTGAAPRPCG